MGRDIYGVDPSTSADGSTSGSTSMCWASMRAPTTATKGQSGLQETENINSGQDVVSRADPPTHDLVRAIVRASSHSGGSANVEIHRSLAALCVLPAR